MYLVHLRGQEHYGWLGCTVHCGIDYGLVENYGEGSQLQHTISLNYSHKNQTLLLIPCRQLRILCNAAMLYPGGYESW